MNCELFNVLLLTDLESRMMMVVVVILLQIVKCECSFSGAEDVHSVVVRITCLGSWTGKTGKKLMILLGLKLHGTFVAENEYVLYLFI